MNLQTFIANFSHVVHAPDGVKNLRQLVMASALAGRFSTPNEDLASDIQTQLEEARSLHFRSSGKRERPLLFGAPLIHEFEIPSGWRWVRVGQICDLQTGATPSTQRPEYWGGEIPWLASGDINRREIFECDGRITEAGLANSNCKILQTNSVLIALNGQGKTRATVALLRMPATCNQSLVAMTPFDVQIVMPEYLFLSLRYRYYEIREITGQDQRRGLNMGLVSELSVPLAPLTEQKRIVAKVNELMALCDQLESQLLECKRSFPVISLSCHARLTEAPTLTNLNSIFDETENVSPDDLRRTILALAVEGRFSLASESKHVALQEVIQLISGQHLLANEQNNERKGIPYLTGPSDFGAKYPIPTRWTETPKVVAKSGDILITVKGSGVGKTNKLVDREMAISRQLMAVRVTGADPDFIHLVLKNASDHFQSLMTGIAIPGIGRKDVLALTAALPSPAEQRRIVAKVDELMTLVDQLEAQQQERDKLAEAFAKASVASFAATVQRERVEKMKAPKTELVSVVTLGKKIKSDAKAPLAKLLLLNKGALPAKALWQHSGLKIDEFYQQLKSEIAKGWISPPAEAEMKVMEEG